MIIYLDETDVETTSKPIPQQQQQPSRMVRMHSAGSDTDTIFARNASKISSVLGNNHQKRPKQLPVSGNRPEGVEKVELFSTDSEMDSFFKENESIVNKANNLYLMTSSSASNSNSPNKNNTDENTMNEELDDDIEFDRIVSEAQR